MSESFASARRLSTIFLLAALSVAPLSPLAAQDATPTPPAEPAATAPAAPAPKPRSSNAEHFPQPPDGKWLVDEEGNEYFAQEIQKVENGYRWVGEKKIQIQYGLKFDVLEERDDVFLVKVYRPRPDLKKPAPEPKQPAPLPVPIATPSDSLRFEPFDRGLPRRGQWRNGFEVADINGDGFADIVHPPERKGNGRPQIFLGDHQGNWKPWQEARFPDLKLDYGDAVVRDFNGDKKLDVALAMHLRGTLVFVHDGKGGFSRWSEGTDFKSPEGAEGPSFFSSRSMEGLDWNGDGRQDLLLMGEGPRLARSGGGSEPSYSSGSTGPFIYLNGGKGQWTRLRPETNERMNFGDDLAVADFNGDKRLDFLTSTSAFGRADILYLWSEGGKMLKQNLPNLPPNSIIRAVAAGDFNRDGRSDAVVGYLSVDELSNWLTGVDVLLQRADGSWERGNLGFVPSRDTIWDVATGDINADGALDVVAATGVGEVWVFLGDGKGNFTKEAGAGLKSLEVNCSGYHVELANVDGRKGDEILVGFAGESGSEVLVPGVVARCASEGSLQVWRAVANKP